MTMTMNSRFHSNRALFRTLVFLTSVLVWLLVLSIYSNTAFAEETYIRTITFDANGGNFNGDVKNVINITYTEQPTEIVKTENIDDDGYARSRHPDYRPSTDFSPTNNRATIIKLDLYWGLSTWDASKLSIMKKSLLAQWT